MSSGQYAFASAPSPEELAGFALNDLGNAMRLIRLVGGTVDEEDGEVDTRDASLLYLRERGWIAFNGKCWSLRGGEELARRHAHKVAQGLQAQRLLIIEKHAITAPKFWEFANRTGGAGGTAAMLLQAQSYLGADLGDFDTDALALNVANGVLRFRRAKGDVEIKFNKGHNARDRFTRVCDAEWRGEDAPRELFDRFVGEILPAEDVRTYVHKVLSYGGTGETKEQLFFIFQGRGGDGKSTLVNAVRETYGTYAATASVETFLDTGIKRAGDASPELARLAGDTRLISTAEPPRGSKLASAMIKSFTGGAPITARELRQGIFEFAPIGKVVLECNNRPAINDTDDGIWRRTRIVLFEVQIPEGRIDQDLPNKLKAERSGILAWIAQGIARWLIEGLVAPAAVRAAVDDYRLGSNPFSEWFAECVEREPGTKTLSSEFLRSYKEWCEREDIEKPMSSTAFGRALGEAHIIRAGKNPAGLKQRIGGRVRTDLEIQRRAAAAAAARDAAPVQDLGAGGSLPDATAREILDF